MVHTLGSLAQIASDWYWEMGPDLRYTAFAGRFEEFTGRPPSDSIGRSRAEIAANAEDPGFWAGHLDDLSHHRAFRDFTYPYAHPDGRTRWFKVSGQPLYDVGGAFIGYQGVGTDITAEREARAALDATLEAMAQGICMFDRDLRLVVCNERYAALFGLSRALTQPGTSLVEILGQSRRAPGHCACPVVLSASWAGERQEGARGAGVHGRDDENIRHIEFGTGLRTDVCFCRAPGRQERLMAGDEVHAQTLGSAPASQEVGPCALVANALLFGPRALLGSKGRDGHYREHQRGNH